MDKNNDSFFEQIKMLKDEADIDKVADLFVATVGLMGFTMDEIAALSFYIMQTSLIAAHNAEFLKEIFGFDAKELTIGEVLDVQEALIDVYLNNPSDQNKAGKGQVIDLFSKD